jgi:hypothetical protein
MKLQDIYKQWVNHSALAFFPEPYSPLYSTLYIERNFGFTYKQSRMLQRMFIKRLLAEIGV